MKLKANEISVQLRSLNPAYRAVLIYGPDEGLVRERAEKIGRQIVEDLKDPFNVAILETGRLKEDPALLADEAAAISMMGGRRLVRVDAAGEAVLPAVQAFLSDAPGDGLVLVTAGDLAAKSGLRKAFEAAKNAVAIPCYLDDARAVESLIREVMQDNGLRIEPEAMGWLMSQLGSDRAISRNELEKLALYKGKPVAGENPAVTLDDAQACVGDSGELTLETIAIATSGGDLQRLDDALFKAFTRGENPVAVIRAVARRLQRLHLVVGEMEQGVPLEQALKELRPPVFFKELPAFKSHIRAWSQAQLASALKILTQAETECKTTGMPAESVCARACLRIANAARR